MFRRLCCYFLSRNMDRCAEHPLTEDGIRDMVRRVHSANFNAILVESFYLGETIYPSPFYLLRVAFSNVHFRGGH